MYRTSFLGEVPAVPAAMPQDSQGGDYFEETKILVFSKVLAANDQLTDLAQFIDKTYDFTFLAVAGTSTGALSLNFKDPGGRDIYTSAASKENSIGTAQFPVPWSHGMTYPAGGRIGITLIDKSAAQNTVELVLIGIARYPTSR